MRDLQSRELCAQGSSRATGSRSTALLSSILSLAPVFTQVNGHASGETAFNLEGLNQGSPTVPAISQPSLTAEVTIGHWVELARKPGSISILDSHGFCEPFSSGIGDQCETWVPEADKWEDSIPVGLLQVRAFQIH